MILVEDLDLLFIHVPQTGGTAVRRYLVEHLGGFPVARQHQVWEQVAVTLPRREHLRVMTSIRDPLDQTVSSYYKVARDHRGTIASGASGARRRRQAAYVSSGSHDFEDWFSRYRRRVFSPRWLGSVRRSRWVLRFESLERDLLAALSEAGWSDLPPLPRVNATARPGLSIEEAYRTGRSRAQAARIFGPFMAEFDYAPPAGWPWVVPPWSDWEYRAGHRARLLRSRVQR